MPQPDIQFIPGFFSPSESTTYMNTLMREIPWQQKKIMIFGKPVLEPRLTAWIGDPDAAYTYSGVRLTPLPWVSPLLEIKKRIEKNTGEKFNSVLANLYRNQQDSMGLHSDDEKELGPEPLIASLSLGETRRFVMKHRILKKEPVKTYFLEPGSLLIMRGQTQKIWKHGVPKETGLCGPRINLTFRRILTPN